jgi:hypothetical protein
MSLDAAVEICKILASHRHRLAMHLPDRPEGLLPDQAGRKKMLGHGAFFKDMDIIPSVCGRIVPLSTSKDPKQPSTTECCELPRQARVASRCKPRAAPYRSPHNLKSLQIRTEPVFLSAQEILESEAKERLRSGHPTLMALAKMHPIHSPTTWRPVLNDIPQESIGHWEPQLIAAEGEESLFDLSEFIHVDMFVTGTGETSDPCTGHGEPQMSNILGIQDLSATSTTPSKAGDSTGSAVIHRQLANK